MRTKKLWCLGAMLLAAAGCGGGISFDEVVPKTSCSEDVDCGNGRVCEGGVCKPMCNETKDCGKNQVCEAGVCRPICSHDGHCNGNHVCSAEGACIIGCRANGDGTHTCVSGYICEGLPGEVGQCVKEPLWCDADCPPGYVCKGGLCTLGCSVEQNGLNDSCTKGYVCERPTGATPDALGTCRPGCLFGSSQKNCGDNSGYTCVLNTSHPRLGTCQPGCRMDQHCPNQPVKNVCDDEAATTEVLGTCKPECSDDNSCGAGYVCEPIDNKQTKICKQGCHTFSNGDGTYSDTCGPSYVCDALPGIGIGACQKGCRVKTPIGGVTSDNCGGGFYCEGKTNQTNDTGTCKPGCRLTTTGGVTSDNCGAGFVCEGTAPNQTSGIGTCKVGCRITTPTGGVTTDNCGDNLFCEGTTNQTNSTGTCKAGCRVGAGKCSFGLVCVGYGGNIAKGAPGLCRRSCTVGATSSCGSGYGCGATGNPDAPTEGSCLLLSCTASGQNMDIPCGTNEICLSVGTIGNACRPGCRTNTGTNKTCLAGQSCSGSPNYRCQ